MNTGLRCRSFVLVYLTLLCLIAGPALADAALEFHYDRTQGISMAILFDGNGNQLAQYPWNGGLPLAYIVDDEDIEIPILLPATMRDLLEDLTGTETTAAIALLESMLGAYANTPASQIPPSLRGRVGYSEYNIEEWCGESIDAFGQCLESEGSSGGPFCKDVACKGTRITLP